MLTELQKRKLTRYFRVYDIDDDGRIGPADFERVVENVRILHGLATGSAGHVALQEGYQKRWGVLSEQADADEDGGVDLAEWLAYWDGVLAVEERYQSELRSLVNRLLKSFDTDEDGVIGAQEFSDFYGVYGLESEMAGRVFKVLDTDDDGVISRQDLIELGHQFYQGDDPDAPGNKLFGPF